MDAWDIISRLLGLQNVFIDDVKLFRRGERAEFWVHQQLHQSQCKGCGLKFFKAHDWRTRRIQGPPLGVFGEVWIYLVYPRTWCKSCKAVTPAKIKWAHPEFESMTCGFSEVAGRLMEETTCEAAGRVLKANSRKLWELDQRRMQLMLERMKLPDDLDIIDLSADEVHFRTIWFKNRVGLGAKRWEAQFVTNLVSYREAKVLYNAPGRGKKSLSDCLQVLSEGQKLAVENFAVDMHDPFVSVIKKQCPNANICIDRFHLAQQVNKTFDEVRRSEFRKAKKNKDGFTQGMLSPSRRFVLVEREKQITKAELKLLAKLRKININIHSGMLLVEYFHTLLDKPNIKSFRKALINWYLLVKESKLKPFRKLAATIRKYRKGIENYINSHLTTAVSEGINTKIKTLKRMGYGYTNPASFRNKILQRCGFLNHYHINTGDLLYEVPFHQ